MKNCKVGDCVVELGPDNLAAGERIVIEAKQKAGYSLQEARNEIATARKNRDAQIGLVVCSHRTAPEGWQSLVRYGNDIVVVWNPEDPATDIFLRVGLTLARALCMKTQQSVDAHTADFALLDAALLEIERRAEGLEEIEKSTAAINNHSAKIAKRVETTRKSLERELGRFRQSIDAIRQEVAQRSSP